MRWRVITGDGCSSKQPFQDVWGPFIIYYVRGEVFITERLEQDQRDSSQEGLLAVTPSGSDWLLKKTSIEHINIHIFLM